MENEVSKVKFEGDNGETFEMTILKEFQYKDKNYAVLMEDKHSCSCGCENDTCECDDDCDCGCTDGNECNCEKGLYILEISKDNDGAEVFKSIEDEKLFDEVINEADRILYEE